MKNAPQPKRLESPRGYLENINNFHRPMPASIRSTPLPHGQAYVQFIHHKGMCAHRLLAYSSAFLCISLNTFNNHNFSSIPKQNLKKKQKNQDIQRVEKSFCLPFISISQPSRKQIIYGITQKFVYIVCSLNIQPEPSVSFGACLSAIVVGGGRPLG